MGYSDESVEVQYGIARSRVNTLRTTLCRAQFIPLYQACPHPNDWRCWGTVPKCNARTVLRRASSTFYGECELSELWIEPFFASAVDVDRMIQLLGCGSLLR
jgi:hypothetical protein